MTQMPPTFRDDVVDEVFFTRFNSSPFKDPLGPKGEVRWGMGLIGAKLPLPISEAELMDPEIYS